MLILGARQPGRRRLLDGGEQLHRHARPSTRSRRCLRAVEERHIAARCPTASARRSARSFAAKGFEGAGPRAGGRRDHRRTPSAGSTPCWRRNMACPRPCARRSRPPPAPSPPSCCAARCPLLPFLVNAPLEFELSIAMTGARVLPDRLGQEPLVAGRAGGARAARPWRSASAPRRSPMPLAMGSRPWYEPGPRRAAADRRIPAPIPSATRSRVEIDPRHRGPLGGRWAARWRLSPAATRHRHDAPGDPACSP